MRKKQTLVPAIKTQRGLARQPKAIGELHARAQRDAYTGVHAMFSHAQDTEMTRNDDTQVSNDALSMTLTWNDPTFGGLSLMDQLSS